nr:MAG TPA: transcription factor [Caudoviricetes sp.]
MSCIQGLTVGSVCNVCGVVIYINHCLYHTSYFKYLFK